MKKLSVLESFLKSSISLLVVLSAGYLIENMHFRGRSFWAVAGLLIILIASGVWLFGMGHSLEKCKQWKFPAGLVWLGISVLAVALLALFFTQSFQLIDSALGRLLLSCVLAVAGALLLNTTQQRSAYLNFAIILLCFGALYRLGVFIPQIQATPFSLGWSEGSRYYNASLFLSESIYGEQLPLPVLHPSRYLMQAVPFFLGIHSILAHRLWQVLLWIGMTAWGAALLAKRFRGKLALPFWLLVIGIALFFFQGAVYFHLMVCVILVLLGYRKDTPWRTLLFVLLASVWAGISRVNWMPVPGLLAAALYLLDEPVDAKNWTKYVQFPVLWAVAGVGTAWLSQQVYIRLSGNDPALFGSAFSSELLWNRLLPNATFSLGIILAILLVCLPGSVLLWETWHNGNKPQVHWLRWLGLAAILLAFLGGGILVSLKIGGGGDLHNLDAFLVFWALIAGSLITGAYSPEQTQPAVSPLKIESFGWILAMVVPVFFVVMQGAHWSFISREAQMPEVQQMQAVLDLLKDQPGKALFIADRQLVTFGEIEGVRMEPDYEKVFLMEMAMGNNKPYLQGFYHQISSHAYKAIITDTLYTGKQGQTHAFGDENDIWVFKVLIPMLEEYEPAASWQDGGVNLLIPKGQPEILQAIQQLAP
jgi:hypothetical protein